MGATPNPVSPKVTSSTLSGAISVLVLYALGQVPFIAALPEPVQAALLVILAGLATFAGGYIKRDPKRAA